MLEAVKHKINSLSEQKRWSRRPKFKEIDDLCEYHFRVWSDPQHINRVGLTFSLRQLGGRPALIVETGTSAWGTDSSRLFAAYTESFGGSFWSVDSRELPSTRLGDLGGSVHFAVDDSVNFLSNFEIPPPYESVSLAYLDSWDLNLENPAPAMEHGLREWHALLPLLAPGSIVVVDDTPIEFLLFGESITHSGYGGDAIPGKGALILKDPFFLSHFEVLYHHYNLVMKWVK